ncbi:protein of unknown function [Fodinibius roseus]|uniref:DUF4412 domain-containing protein n=1 Tax=Fodinibius roseus TaxID=1194090 RepID=A0A1M5FHI3_9BACT|nr:DUF4412 domain-containing protein [Fodinibius roseus]SHF90948.1 protein of unknown function [Fodinibius roseus]
MRYLIVILAAGLMSVTFTIEAEAQLFNRLKDKAKKAAAEKAEEKLSEKVEEASRQAVEDSWNAVFGDMSADSASGGMSVPFSMGSNVDTEEAYHFDTITTMEIETTRENGESDPPVIMDMHFNTEERYTGTRFSGEGMKREEGNLFIIYDFNNSAMLMLMENEKDKFSFAYDWKQASEYTANSAEARQAEDVDWDEVDEWQGYTKIGTKTIQGYECDGYRSENSDGVVEVWVSRDDTFGMQNMFKANANAKQMRGKIPEDYPYGMMMEMTSEDRQSGDKTVMKVTDIQKNARVTYEMADYPTMSLGGKKAGK